MKPLPPQLQAALQTAARAFHAGDHRRTQTLCLELLRRAGPRPDVLNLKGLSELHAGQSEAAANSLRAALKLEPRRAELHLNLALAESELARWRAVKQHALEAARLAPQQPRVVYQAARCCRDAQDFATAQRLADRAAALAPDEPDGWHLKGSIHLDLGDMSAAKAAFARAVEADPQHARSLALLSSLEKTGTDDTARIAQLQAVRDSGQAAAERSTAAFALANIQRRAGHPEEAFRQYRQANALAAADRPFDLPAWQARMDAVVARSMDAAPTGAPGTGEGARHVFVVGMPRSGTSLLEQVLSSHEGVFGCGEVETLALLEERLGGPGADVAARREAAAFYVQTLPRGHESARLTIDKQMLNFERVDFLLELFPGARLLWSRRHPLDTILSCYFQNFQAGINWSMDLDAIVATYIRHEAMMRHWMGRFPDHILAVRYEDLVDDLEGQARRLGDFLGIGFDPAMLSPHETERAVLTASNQQVRNPLYRSSMGYWRDYRNELTPAIAALREAGVELPGVDETA